MMTNRNINTSRRLALRNMLLLSAPVLMPAGAFAQSASTTLDVVYVPTPQPVVDRMLDMAKVGPGDVLYDLGCGDGRLVVSAALRGARGVGMDLNPERIAEANANARAAGVVDKVQFNIANLFDTDLSSASVVTLYLLPGLNLRLRPQLWKQLKVGSRVVSHAFDMGTEWLPEETDKIEESLIFKWTITEAHKRA